MSRAQVSVALMTAPSMKVATTIARTLLDERLIACANVVPAIRSLYRWKGKVCDEAEVMVVLKLRRTDFARVRSRVVALHPYEVPEVIRLDVAAGHRRYLDWISSSTAR